MSELADKLGSVVAAHSVAAPGAVEACRQERQSGSVQELGLCVVEGRQQPTAERLRTFLQEEAPQILEALDGAGEPRQRRSAWLAFLAESASCAKAKARRTLAPVRGRVGLVT